AKPNRAAKAIRPSPRLARPPAAGEAETTQCRIDLSGHRRRARENRCGALTSDYFSGRFSGRQGFDRGTKAIAPRKVGHRSWLGYRTENCGPRYRTNDNCKKRRGPGD